MKLEALKSENAAMEKEIMALTKGATAMGGTKGAAEAPTSGIRVLKFDQSSHGDGAGIDHGSSWCPPQCSRRTVLGGFFTS